MRTKTTSTQVYTFDELSDDAKERARDWYRESMTSPEDFGADNVIEDAARMAALFGLNLRTRPVPLMGGSTRHDPDVYWALDRDKGASFAGSYGYRKGSARAVAAEAPSNWTDRQTGKREESKGNTELNNIVDSLAEVQRRNFYQVQASIGHGRARSPYSGSMDIDVERADGKAMTDADVETVRQCLRDFADWIADTLEQEYEYQYSADCVDDNIRANDYEFDENGKRA